MNQRFCYYTQVGTALVISLLLAATAVAQSDTPKKFEGRPLADVLKELQALHLNIVFSSELVKPEMRVASEPKSAVPRRILDEILRPLGLEVRSGPRGALLVIHSRRAPAPAATRSGPTGTVAGTVIDSRTALPLAGVMIAVQGLHRTTTTDAKGGFTLTDLPTGPVALYVSLVGYGLARPAVDIAEHATTEITVPLADGTGTYTEAVTVEGDPSRGTQSSVAMQQALNSAEIGELRGVLTDDPFRAIQSLPSVSAANDFRSEFSIRGSDFHHIGLSIDGVALPWPVHAIRDTQTTGSIAIMNGDIIDGVVVSDGARPVQQPGRIGAWVDFSVREGSRAGIELHGAVSASSASVVAEGPLGASKRGSWLVSARQSYLQWLLKGLGYDHTTFGFSDVQSKIVFDVTPGQQFQLTTIGGRSRFDQADTNPGPRYVGVGTGGSFGGVVGWRSMFGSSILVTQRLAVLGDTFHNQGATTVLGRGTAADFSYRADATWTPRPAVMFQLGAYLQRQRQTMTTTQFLDTSAGMAQAQRTTAVDGSAWQQATDVRAVWSPGKRLSLDMGTRIAHSTLTDDTTAKPWLLSRLSLNQSWSLRAGASLADQIPDFESVIGTFGRRDARRERSRHLDIGLEHQVSPHFRWQVAIYDRHENDILRLEDGETRLQGNQLVFASSLTPSWRNALAGSARGVEVVVERRGPARFTGSLGYSFGRQRYHDAVTGESFRADFDQRHTLTGYGQFRLSPKMSLGAKMRLGSNFPVPGYFEQRSDGLFVGSDRNAVRLPAYARLDLRADRSFTYDHRRLTLFLEVINVFNRSNLAPANGVVSTMGQAFNFTEPMFPVLPSAGIRLDF
jgi:CarboxypepD_reg-like domain